MAIKEIKYGDVEQRAQTIKTYIDEASAKAVTEAGSYTDEQVSAAKAYTDEKIGSIPAPDIPAALPQKYEAFEIQLPQGTNYHFEGEAPAWVEYHKTLWKGSETLTESDSGASFVSNVVLYWDAPRGYSLLITVDGAEKELKFAGVQSSQGTRWATWSYSENGTVAIQAKSFGQRNGGYWNNTSAVDVYCPSGSAYIGKAMTKVRYGRKQYSYILQNPYVVLQRPTEAEATRFNTMCQNLFKQKAKVRFTLTEREIEANYVNLSEELVTTSYSEGDSGLTWLNVISDRVPLKVGDDVTDDMPTCIKGILEVEYTDEEATKECVYDKIQGESYTFKIGDFNHKESSAFDYYFNGAALIPWDNAQLQSVFTYRPVSGTEKTITAKSLINNGQMLPYFDISELFGQAANTVMAMLISNRAIENEAMLGRPVTTVTLTRNVQSFTDANDEIMISQILTLMPENLPQTYKKKAVTLATSGWSGTNQIPVVDWIRFGSAFSTKSKIAYGDFSYLLPITEENASLWRASYKSGSSGSETTLNNQPGSKMTGFQDRVTFNWPGGTGMAIQVTADGLYAYGYNNGGSMISLSANVTLYNLSLTDTDVKVNSEIRFTLDEANGKLAGQFGLKKTIDKEAGKLTFTADTLPTSAITGTLEIGDTSTEGAAFVEGITSDTTGFVKATEENTFTKTQTFNGTESQAGIKTNAIDNENGNRVVYFNGEKQMFGSGAIPTQVRSSEQRLKLERPVSGGTGTEIVEVANLSDVSGKQDKITTDNKLDVSLVSGLATVATSGSYNDLSNKPTIPSPVTETTVSDWGFTKNTGTVTSVAVKMNGAAKGTVTSSGTIDLGTVLTSWDDVGSEAVISIIGKALYPVGAIYMSTANVNPSTFIAGTTWVAWGSGKVPVGVDTSDTSFNTVEKTGGEKTHTLTESEMPKHSHTGTQSIDADVYSQKDPTAVTPTVQYERKRHTADFTTSTIETITAYEQGTRLATDLVEVDYGIEKGGDSAHNNLQPYITCYMFKRTE